MYRYCIWYLAVRMIYIFKHLYSYPIGGLSQNSLAFSFYFMSIVLPEKRMSKKMLLSLLDSAHWAGLTQECPDGYRWIWMYFNQCVVKQNQLVGFVCGLTAILVTIISHIWWAVFLIASTIINHRNLQPRRYPTSAAHKTSLRQSVTHTDSSDLSDLVTISWMLG